MTGTGEVEDSRVGMPPKCHLVIANRPYTPRGRTGRRTWGECHHMGLRGRGHSAPDRRMTIIA